MLASCSGDKTVRIWSRRRGPAAANGAPVGDAMAASVPADPQQHPQQQHWYCSAILDQCHTRTIRSVAWAPSGRALATASFDATVAIWELSGGVWEQVAELEGHENEVKCVAWNPDGRLIATCGRDRSVWIWESMPGREYECVDVKQGHSQDVKVVRWHPGGELLVSAGYDDTLRLWTYDGDEWGCAQTLGGSGFGPGHESTVWDVAWDPTGQRLASCSDDRTVKVWEVRPGAGAGAGGASGAGAETRGGEGPADAGGGGAAAAGGGGGGGERGVFVPSKPDLRCGATLSGYHVRTVFALDWGRLGLIATGDGEDSIQVFGQGDPDAAALQLRAAERHAPHPTPPAAPAQAQAQAGEEGAQAAGSDGPGPGLLGEQRGAWGRWARVEGAHESDINCVRWSPVEPQLLASSCDDGAIKLWWLAAR
ncbi:hypothetical protein HYH03_016675 [Edaphochlamys debaryana]|uniref:Probable cytosolic iron-sulfur protein assembly protein CIAO1 homolog n=1 Tax=Edaphochlamys debaryana TaxID=47281 RepID=A0A836BPX2_9CHLO|nr:hypothetical protein HYH03_016675 [Edaphochlamys debaryana]|eukprot:KAG2484540.1 hypothetical protein HYH03_016675 [Edaphochlamys debaryana]